MNDDEQQPQSFSLARRWGAGLNLVVTLAAVLSIVAMLNYLGMRHYVRSSWTRSADTDLSRRTRHVLASLTNTVKVVTYFNSEDDVFARVRALLKEYENAAGGKLRVQHVDYLRDPTLANVIQAQYKLPSNARKDLVIFDSGARVKIVNAAELSAYDYSNLMGGKSREVHRTHFKGEPLFTSALFGLISQRSPKAYFLIGHGEHNPADTSGEDGYSKFASILHDENNFDLQLLDLIASKAVPADCNLLIIPGPLQTIGEEQVDRIQRYLEQGGRLLVLFNYRPVGYHRPSGLEKLLLNWGVEVGQNVVLDPENATNERGMDPLPVDPGAHPIVNSLGTARVHLYMPRSMRAAKNSTTRREENKVEELLFTGARSMVITELSERGMYDRKAAGPQPLAAAVEKTIPGLERGSTRIVAIGDSTFWANQLIELDANREFVSSTVNWLVAQNALLQDIPPRAIKSYKLSLTQTQMRTVRWLLLGGLPGGVLLVGLIVWSRRRR
jgi:ABC-type uncharacterized transport system involved in gliding motility auxiliary subunit